MKPDGWSEAKEWMRFGLPLIGFGLCLLVGWSPGVTHDGQAGLLIYPLLALSFSSFIVELDALIKRKPVRWPPLILSAVCGIGSIVALI